jgi:two-component system, OmpR family, alkaline phosphatase synthesis response regulator PhoP
VRTLMEKETIIVVDGKSVILKLLRRYFPRDVCTVKGVFGCGKVLSEVIHNPPDLILVDLKPPGQDGFSVCRELKSNPQTARIPIIIAAAKGRDSDVVTGRLLGAAGCLTRPLSPRVLQTVVEGVLRKKNRQADIEGDVLTINGLMINPLDHNVILNGAALRLTTIEFAVLCLLARRPGHVFTRYQITRSVKGRNLHDTDRSLDVQISQLRRKLGADARMIETVRGMGYRFKG